MWSTETIKKNWEVGSLVNRERKRACVVLYFCFCFSLEHRVFPAYLAIKKSSLGTRAGFMLAFCKRLFEATLCLPHLRQFWECGCQGCRLQDPLGPSSPAVAFFILLSMRGCGSFPESIPRVSLCLTLPFCILRAFYSSHCSANVTIVRLLGMAQAEESDFPVGRREGSFPPTWFVDPRAVQWLCQGTLAEMSHCGKRGLGSGVVWQCAMWAPTANSSGCDDSFSRLRSSSSPKGDPFSWSVSLL